jgi:hypothetical protein
MFKKLTKGYKMNTQSKVANNVSRETAVAKDIQNKTWISVQEEAKAEKTSLGFLKLKITCQQAVISNFLICLTKIKL